MALRYHALRGLTVGTTAELATHTKPLLEDQAAYNSQTGQLVVGPGLIADLMPAAKTTPVLADTIIIGDSAAAGAPKRITLTQLKAALA